MRKLLTYREFCEFTGIPLATAYSLVARRRVPHVRLSRRLVRFDVDEIQRWLTAHAVADVPGARAQAGVHGTATGGGR
jgi:excisionase family DNA binding protein